ncbi:MAG: hypothetical protein AB7O37_21045 [Vicinamibacteria bacterium]
MDAATRVEIERRSCGPLTPSYTIGITAHGRGFVTLAERLVAAAWEKDETFGIARMVNPETGIAVALCSGDGDVGLASGRPRSKCPHGVGAATFVKHNEQMEIPFPGRPRTEAAPPCKTYWLMTHSNGKDVLRAELSLPVGVDDENYFSIWHERVILDMPPVDSLAGRRVVEDEPLDIVVNIRPKI